MGRSSRRKVNKEILTLHDTFERIDLIDINRTFHPKGKECVFSSAHGTFSRTDHMLGHKISSNKCKKTELMLSKYSNHNGMNLEMFTRRILGKPQIYGG